MATTKKCDITGIADEPTIVVGDKAMLIVGDKLNYTISIQNNNGMNAIDVLEAYVIEELIKLLTPKLNSLKNPAKKQNFSKVDETPVITSI